MEKEVITNWEIEGGMGMIWRKDNFKSNHITAGITIKKGGSL
jgi:hypothetical protein